MRKLLIVSLLVLFSSTCFAQYRGGGRVYAPGRYYRSNVYRGYGGYRPYYRGVYPRYYAPGYAVGYAPYYYYYDPYPVYVRPVPRIVVGPTVVIGGGGWRRFHR